METGEVRNPTHDRAYFRATKDGPLGSLTFEDLGRGNEFDVPGWDRNAAPGMRSSGGYRPTLEVTLDHADADLVEHITLNGRRFCPRQRESALEQLADERVRRVAAERRAREMEGMMRRIAGVFYSAREA